MRLIDAEALQVDGAETTIYVCGLSCSSGEYVFKNQIDKAPTIEPIKRGEWEAPFAGRAICSVCKQDQDVEMFVGNPTQAYCARCGADMRMENKD